MCCWRLPRLANAGCCVVCSWPVDSTACVLLQGAPEPTCHSFRQLVSLPLPNPDILERSAGVQGALPREQGSGSPGPAALPVSQAQSPGIPALDLLAHCAEVGSLQPVTMMPMGRGPSRRILSRATAIAIVLDVCQCVPHCCRACSSRSSLPWWLHPLRLQRW